MVFLVRSCAELLEEKSLVLYNAKHVPVNIGLDVHHTMVEIIDAATQIRSLAEESLMIETKFIRFLLAELTIILASAEEGRCRMPVRFSGINRGFSSPYYMHIGYPAEINEHYSQVKKKSIYLGRLLAECEAIFELQRFRWNTVELILEYSIALFGEYEPEFSKNNKQHFIRDRKKEPLPSSREQSQSSSASSCLNRFFLVPNKTSNNNPSLASLTSFFDSRRKKDLAKKLVLNHEADFQIYSEDYFTTAASEKATQINFPIKTATVDETGCLRLKINEQQSLPNRKARILHVLDSCQAAYVRELIERDLVSSRNPIYQSSHQENSLEILVTGDIRAACNCLKRNNMCDPSVLDNIMGVVPIGLSEKLLQKKNPPLLHR